MNLTRKEKKTIQERSKELENIKVQLKKEFIGIDAQIDQVIDAMRPYYIFPKSLKRPLVVNLFGMTGTGKTHLIDRIIDLLSLRHKYFKFDVGDYAKESSDWKLKHDISESIKNSDGEDTDLVVVFDEFQFGRTIDENGKEVDRSSLRPMWELIDSGIIYVSSFSSFHESFDHVDKIKKVIKNGVVVRDGVVREREDIFYTEMYRNASPDWVRVFDYEKHIPKPPEEKDKKKETSNTSSDEEISYTEDMTYGESYDPNRFIGPYLIRYNAINAFYNANPGEFGNTKANFKEWRETVNKMDPQTMLAYLHKTFIMNTPLMKKMDYSQSLIFVIGNIDEAYIMSHSSDPDADPDLFYEHSKKITLPKMKYALSARFRMEQIGRLGNNIIIYPSLSSDSYKKIIDKHLNERVKYFKEEFGINLTFTSSMKDIVYKESVFPTQGVRPVLSTFNTFVDSYTAKIISDFIGSKEDVKTAEWDFEELVTKDENQKDKDSAKHIIKTKNNKFEYPVRLQVENLRKSDKSEQQLFTAVHEAGHTVLAMSMLSLCPKVVMSKTASATSEGFTQVESPSYKTKSYMINELSVLLAGRAAELLVFGEENLSQGATSDLDSATTTAVSIVKSYGMGDNVYNIQCRPTAPWLNLSNDDIVMKSEQEAINIFNKANSEALRQVDTHLDKIIELSEFLSVNSKIEKHELLALANKWGFEIKDKDNYYNFKKIFSNIKSGKAKRPVT